VSRTSEYRRDGLHSAEPEKDEPDEDGDPKAELMRGTEVH